MRRITLWVLSTVTTLVLLFSYHTSTSSAGTTSPPSVVAGSGSSGSSASSGSSSSSGSGSSSSGSSGSSSGSSGASGQVGGSAASSAQTYAGDTVDTQWGPVQVQITVAGGAITSADVLQVPSGNHRDQEINAYAVPVLNAEVVNAQSANIDMVSGATVTSDGYVRSLQSAIDQAGL
jgi:uncharacterized protein with FMN-binding domain